MGRIASFGVGAAISLGPSIALPPIYNFGTEEMKKQIIPQVLAGDKTICLAITEPFAGSDVANMQTAAVESADGSHFVINGEKVK